jgi:hypothetical protein
MAIFIIQHLSQNVKLTAFTMAIIRRLAQNPKFQD